jgi:hypothetical protein
MSNLMIHAFCKGNWPVVIDYGLEEQSLVLLTVAKEGVASATYRLEAHQRRQVEVLHLPSRFGEDTAPGWYWLRAFSLASGELRPVHIHIFGIGAGPKAVGSMMIDALSLQPNLIHVHQKEKTAYSFRCLSDFDEADASFLFVYLTSDNEIVARRVKSEKINKALGPNDVVNKQWDGKGDSGQVSIGQHELAVRAWRGLRQGGDWITALSDQFLTVD